MLLSNAQRSGGSAPAGTPPPAAALTTRPPLLTPSFFQQAVQAVCAGPTLPYPALCSCELPGLRCSPNRGAGFSLALI